MKHRIIICMVIAVIGCDSRDISLVGCTYGNEAPKGRNPQRYARCAANPNNGVRQVGVKFHKPGERLYSTGSYIALSQAEQDVLLGILSRASSIASKQYDVPGGAAKAEFSIVVFEKRGRARSLPVRLGNVEPYYGDELGKWVRETLPRLISAQERLDATKPPPKELTSAEEAAMLKFIEENQKYIDGPDGKLIPNPKRRKDNP